MKARLTVRQYEKQIATPEDKEFVQREVPCYRQACYGLRGEWQ
jgi:hypothetical protein